MSDGSVVKVITEYAHALAKPSLRRRQVIISLMATIANTTTANYSEKVESLTDYMEYQIANCLALYVAPCLFVIGIAGNSVSLIVLLGRTFRKSSLGFTLGALAVVDTAVLCTALPRQWILSITDEDIDVRSLTGAVGCKIHFFLTYYLSHLSSWTVVVVTVERALHVGRPINAKVMCTRCRVIAVWLCTALILAAISFHFFITVTYPYIPADPDPISSDANTTDDLICYVQPAYEWFFVSVWYWMDFTLLAVVPFAIVLAGNCVIIACVVRAVRFRYRQDSLPGPRSGGGATTGDKNKAVTSSTLMLMTVSLVFLLTTSPNVIYFLKVDDWIAEADDARSKARLHLAFTVTNLLYYTNNATNFFLYCLAGSRFRQAMCQMFSCRQIQEGRSGRAMAGRPVGRCRVEMGDQHRCDLETKFSHDSIALEFISQRSRS